MVAIADIYQFIQAELEIPAKELSETTDLYGTFKINGDRCENFIQAFAQKFKVDLTDYLWYFHHGEGGLNIGKWFFKPPYERVDRIPITPALLLRSATKKRWKINYPDHNVVLKRWDMLINKGIVFFVFFYAFSRLLPLLAEKFG